jgi:hypothetical protein
VQGAMLLYVTYKTSGITPGEAFLWLLAGVLLFVVVGVLDSKYVYKDESLASAKFALEKTVELIKQ